MEEIKVQKNNKRAKVERSELRAVWYWIVRFRSRGLVSRWSGPHVAKSHSLLGDHNVRWNVPHSLKMVELVVRAWGSAVPVVARVLRCLRVLVLGMYQLRFRSLLEQQENHPE